MSGDDEGKRKLFHSEEGRIQWSRLIEQLIPAGVTALIVIYANSLVTSSQLSTIKDDVTGIKTQVAVVQGTVGSQNAQIVGVQTQMAGYIATQNQLNASINDRVLYIERAMRVPAISYEEPYRAGQPRNTR